MTHENLEILIKDYMQDVKDLKLAAEYLMFLFENIEKKSYIETGHISISFDLGIDKYIHIVKLVDHLTRLKDKYDLKVPSNDN